MFLIVFKLALAIPTGTSIAVAKEAIETPPLAADKIIKALLKKAKVVLDFLDFFFNLNCVWSIKFGYTLGVSSIFYEF